MVSWSTMAAKKATLGNLAFDGMTIRHGLRWHNSTGCFAGLADEGSDRAGTTPQKMFLAQAVKLAEQAAAAAGPGGGDSAAAAAAGSSSSSSSSSSSTPADANDGVSDAAAAGTSAPMLAHHHLVVYYTPLSGERFRFICARVDLASATAEFLAELLRQIIRDLNTYVHCCAFFHGGVRFVR